MRLTEPLSDNSPLGLKAFVNVFEKYPSQKTQYRGFWLDDKLISKMCKLLDTDDIVSYDNSQGTRAVMIVSNEKYCVLSLDPVNDIISYFYDNTISKSISLFDNIIRLIDNYCVDPHKIHDDILCRNGDEYYLRTEYDDKIDTSIPKELLFGEDIKQLDEAVDKLIHNSNPGHIILTGNHGCGMYKYVSYMIQENQDVKFVQINEQVMAVNPKELIEYMKSHKEYVYLFASCNESVSGQKDSPLLAGILFGEDEILIDPMDVRVIIAADCKESNIHWSFFNPKRMLCKHEFSPLDAEHANKLSQYIGGHEFTKACTMSEVLNQRNMNTSIGFR